MKVRDMGEPSVVTCGLLDCPVGDAAPIGTMRRWDRRTGVDGDVVTTSEWRWGVDEFCSDDMRRMDSTWDDDQLPWRCGCIGRTGVRPPLFLRSALFTSDMRSDGVLAEVLRAGERIGLRNAGGVTTSLSDTVCSASAVWRRCLSCCCGRKCLS